MQHEVLDGIFTFYDSTSARLHIYQVWTSYVGVYPCECIVCVCVFASACVGLSNLLPLDSVFF